ncbi:protease-4 [Cyclonatronum proteinivorum]|uniref:Protease-4 n=1 Tax=Cyclonatronum proteinivorum TaxID=1457365 RepID=A0A345UG95_9BACT|nr:S49 family peptidase [Cyclonatronum proteinivorum]AXI99496.1 protease-4 [Cyclonatronum proteinivorum]
MKKKLLLFLFIPLLSFTAAQAQFSSYGFHERNDFLLASPGAMKFGLYGFDNPALLAYVNQFDLLFQFSDHNGFGEDNRSGLFLAAPGIGFSVLSDQLGPETFRNYSLGLGFGDDRGAFGISYNWNGGDSTLFELKRFVTLGSVSRINRFVSVGSMASFSVDDDDYEVVFDVGVRPFGTPKLALFADYAIPGVAIGEGNWSAGAAIEALPGVRLTGRYLHDIGFTTGLQFSFGRSGVSTQTHLDTGGSHQFNTYGIRLGAMDRNIFDRSTRSNAAYLTLNLRGPMVYQNNRFFDSRNTLAATLETIRDAKEDPRIAGITINTTGMAISPVMIWEIREALQDFRSAGKKVLIYIERGGMSHLHLASVADYVVMDPMGGLMISGYASSSTYLKDLLDHYGIGVDEFREMTHKSAFEAFARSEGSEEDREQRMDLINGYYEVTRADVSRGRNISHEDFDALIDGALGLLPRDLLEAGIVDTLARNTELDDIIRELEDRRMQRISTSDLLANTLPRDDYWGARPQIAVIYAIGGTQTEGGIQARRLARDIRAARNDNNIRAVVLRADSPGGDALASDLVAQELLKTQEEKPVVVSMGNVAASGGYWISMYSDAIVVAPNTVTGSIGVISGWIYDDGLTDRLRLNYEVLSRGESADLMGGPSLPLLGLGLPGRNLTEHERERLIGSMLSLYDDFIEKVAEGRDMSEEEVRAVAEGRVWTGEQAVANGLADEIGSLQFAIDLAREKASLGADEPFELFERPVPQAFDLFSALPVPSIIRARFSQEEAMLADPLVEYLKMRIAQNGQPTVGLPLEYYQLIYELTQPR